MVCGPWANPRHGRGPQDPVTALANLRTVIPWIWKCWTWITPEMASEYPTSLSELAWCLGQIEHTYFFRALTRWRCKFHHVSNPHYKPLSIHLYLLTRLWDNKLFIIFCNDLHYQTKLIFPQDIQNLWPPILPVPSTPIPLPPLLPTRDHHWRISVNHSLWLFWTIAQDCVSWLERFHYRSLDDLKLCILPLFGVFSSFCGGEQPHFIASTPSPC